MSGGQIVALAVAAYLVVAAGVLGALLERERLLNPDGERGWRWLGALAVVVVFWPCVGFLWPHSRPVPSPQPPPGDAPVVLPDGLTAVDTPASLALCGRVQVGERVWVKSLGLVLTRMTMAWVGDCGCRYNTSGFPVVLCRRHRSDVDPQGEPDDDEGSVGR